MNTENKLKEELELLLKQGKEILANKWASEATKELARRGKKDITPSEAAKRGNNISSSYQIWYSKSLPVIQQLLPERYIEFQEYYKLDKRKGIDVVTYTINDYLMGITQTKYTGEETFSSLGVFTQKFQSQIDILESAVKRIDSLLVNIKGVLQAELFDDELQVANELFKKKHLRAAGAVAGVVVERHLGQVAQTHSIIVRKSDPSIGDLNDLLKNAGILDIPNWRLNQRLGDIRNLCVHSKEREPTPEEVEDLIRGAEKVIKTIF